MLLIYSLLIFVLPSAWADEEEDPEKFSMLEAHEFSVYFIKVVLCEYDLLQNAVDECFEGLELENNEKEIEDALKCGAPSMAGKRLTSTSLRDLYCGPQPIDDLIKEIEDALKCGAPSMAGKRLTSTSLRDLYCGPQPIDDLIKTHVCLASFDDEDRGPKKMKELQESAECVFKAYVTPLPEEKKEPF